MYLLFNFCGIGSDVMLFLGQKCPHWSVSMHVDCLLMLDSVAMEKSTHHRAHRQHLSVCPCVWNQVMWKGMDAFSSNAIGFLFSVPSLIGYFLHTALVKDGLQ